MNLIQDPLTHTNIQSLSVIASPSDEFEPTRPVQGNGRPAHTGHAYGRLISIRTQGYLSSILSVGECHTSNITHVKKKSVKLHARHSSNKNEQSRHNTYLYHYELSTIPNSKESIDVDNKMDVDVDV